VATEEFCDTDVAAWRRRRPVPQARHLAATPAGRVLVGAVVALAAATVIGLLALWPHDGAGQRRTQALGGPTLAATVVAAREIRCPGPVPQRCRQLTVKARGSTSPLTLGPVTTSPRLSPGTPIRVAETWVPKGARGALASERYTFVSVDRRPSMLLLGIVLGVLALVVLWWRGLLAVIGVGLSVLLLVTFLVPAILEGRSPLLVALVGSMAVMFVTVVLTNGVGAQALAAALGVAAALALTTVLAAVAVHIAHFSGQSSEVALVLSNQDHGLSLQGVVLAGMVIGALGVLADTAVTQASAVMALRRANPRLGSGGLYRGAFVVGRDHLSATIHTLVLAYAGAALPLLLLMRSTGVRTTDALNVEDVAEPIMAALVGCIGLIAAVPLTTGLAALLVSRVPAELVPDGHHHHHHH
jgi:uncharacterized membrane protein